MRPAEYERMFAAEERHWWYVGLHELILSHLRRAAAEAGRRPRVLDAGCGTGRLWQLMAPVADVEGCDASPLAVAYCRRRGLPARQADLNTARFPPARYDLVTSIDVLYHRDVLDDRAVLCSFREALRPGGRVILNVPAFEFLRGPHDVAVLSRERYRRRTLGRRLAAAGFRPEVLTYRLALLFPFLAVHRLARRLLPPRADAEVLSDVRLPPPALNRALLAAVRLENRLLERWPLPFGTSVFAVARRGAE